MRDETDAPSRTASVSRPAPDTEYSLGAAFRAPVVLLISSTVFIVWLLVGRSLDPRSPLVLSTAGPRLDTFLTSHLFHWSGWHLCLNLAVVGLVGGLLESRWGSLRFLCFYGLLVLGSTLACWVAAVVARSVAGGGVEFASFGASGLALGSLAALAGSRRPVPLLGGALGEQFGPRHIVWTLIFLGCAGLAFLDRAPLVVTEGDADGPVVRSLLMPQIAGLFLAWGFLRIDPRLQAWLSRSRQVRAEREAQRVHEIRHRVDRLLERISSHGYDSLSAAEKNFLRESSQHFKREDD